MSRNCVRTWVAGLGALLLCASVARAGHYTWTTNGPEPGRIFQILADSQDANRLYTRTGLFGSTMFRSEDAGASWRFVENWPVSDLVSDPTDPDVLYTSSAGSVIKTIDGGRTWAPADSGLPSGTAYPLALAPSSPSTLYVAVGSPQTLYRSDDAGASWAAVGPLPGLGGFLEVDAFDPQTLYVPASNGILVSHDGGAGWVPEGAGLPPGFSKVASDPRVAGTVWAYDSVGGGVFESTDGGANFLPANSGIETQAVLDLAFDRNDPARIYAAASASYSPTGPGGLFLSTNGGGSWSPIDLGLQGSPSVRSVAIDPANSQRVLAGALELSRGRLMVTDDGGATWQRHDHGLSGYYSYVAAPHPTEPDSAFGFSSARFFATVNGADDWSQVGETQFTVDHLVFDATDSSILYGQYSGTSGGVYRTVNGGVDWSDASSGLTNGAGRGLAIGVSDPNVLLASNTDGIFLSVDGAGSWNQLLSGFGRAVAVDPADSQILYAAREPDGSGNPTLQRSPDGGATWNAPSGVPASLIPHMTISPDDPLTVYVAAGSHVFKSTDRGSSFTSASAGLPSTPDFFIYRIALDRSTPGTLYVGGVSAPIHRSTDGGAHWQPLPGQVPFTMAFFDLSVSMDGRRLYSATDNGISVFERSFLDVPDGDMFWRAVDAAAMNGLTTGCGQGDFCPTAINTRAQVSVFLLRGKNGAGFDPPPATGTVFGDVPADSFAAAWIEELSLEGITSGCGGGDYCPTADLSRAEMAVMVLKALHGASYAPPPATGTVFGDVPANAFAAAWIEELYNEGISAGCGGGNFCPDASLTRAQAAALLTRAFQLS